MERPYWLGRGPPHPTSGDIFGGRVTWPLLPAASSSRGGGLALCPPRPWALAPGLSHGVSPACPTPARVRLGLYHGFFRRPSPVQKLPGSDLPVPLVYIYRYPSGVPAARRSYPQACRSPPNPSHLPLKACP